MRNLIALLFLWPVVLSAQEIEVDVELFLAVDVSRSMTAAELEIQRRGYAEAISSPQVIDAIKDGLVGRIAVTYVEWAGLYAQRVLVPWAVVETHEDALEIADTIINTPHSGLRRTSISAALRYAADDFDNNGFNGLRRVIDISGDGPNNQGPPVLEARAYALSKGATINGLPLMTFDAMSELWGIPDLDRYYEDCVIGGPGAFVVPVLAWDQFASAVQRKLVLEIAQKPTLIVPVRYSTRSMYDCLAGEKLWERNKRYFALP